MDEKYDINRSQIEKNYHYLMGIFPKGYMKIKMLNSKEIEKERQGKSVNHFPKYLFSNPFESLLTKADYYTSKKIILTNRDKDEFSFRKKIGLTMPVLSEGNNSHRKKTPLHSISINNINNTNKILNHSFHHERDLTSEKCTSTRNELPFKTSVVKRSPRKEMFNMHDIKINRLLGTNKRLKGSPIRKSYIKNNIFLPSLPSRMKNIKARYDRDESEENKELTCI